VRSRDEGSSNAVLELSQLQEYSLVVSTQLQRGLTQAGRVGSSKLGRAVEVACGVEDETSVWSTSVRKMKGVKDAESLGRSGGSKQY